MVHENLPPTLLIFTLGPECEQSRRRLLPGPLRVAETLLHRQGLERALSAGRLAGYRIVVSSPGPLDLPPDIEQVRQRGYSFASRLRGAIRELTDGLAGSPLIVVGTDVPDLNVQHLRAAVARLENSATDVVLGPSHDGGFYLLAMRSVLDDELANVRWCCPQTRLSLEAALRDKGRMVWHLQPLQDLDRYSDVEAWLTSKTSVAALSWLRRWLTALLADWRRPAVPRVLLRPSQVLASGPSGRAPPL